MQDFPRFTQTQTVRRYPLIPKRKLTVKQTSCRRKESDKILETWKIRVASPVDLLLLKILFVTEKKRARARERKFACETAESFVILYVCFDILFISFLNI